MYCFEYPHTIGFSESPNIAVQALAVTSQFLTINPTSESLSASGLHTPHTGKPGSVNEAVSSGRMSAISPTSMQTPLAHANGEDTLMVASDGAQDEGVMQVKAEV